MIEQHLLANIKNNHSGLTSLDLSNQGLTEDAIGLLIEALANNTYLTSLKLAGNSLSLVSIQRITSCNRDSAPGFMN